MSTATTESVATTSPCDDCGRDFDRDPFHFDCTDDPRQWGAFNTWAIATDLTSRVLGRSVHLALSSSGAGAVI